jgi:hypothetical protein
MAAILRAVLSMSAASLGAALLLRIEELGFVVSLLRSAGDGRWRRHALTLVGRGWQKNVPGEVSSTLVLMSLK